MSWNDFESLFGRLALTVSTSTRADLDELANAIYSAYHAVSKTRIELIDLVKCSGSKPSGIPGLIRRSLDLVNEKLSIVLLECPPNSLSSAGIFQSDKNKLFATLSGALDVLRELYDITDPARRPWDIDYWSTWATMETRFAMDDVKELLHSIAYPTAPKQPAYPYRPILSLTGIRLLVIHPDIDPESVIRCSLIYETDYNKRAYAALSYVWGEPGNPQPNIILEGISFPVTLNLHTALKQFRHNSRRRVLWVDAVCINQADKIDKSQQVSRMHQIYRSSACILMWVGEAGNDGQFAIQWLREVQTAGLQRLDYACHNNTIRNHWPAIRSFFRKPYWGRVWILQEAISRDDSLVYYGAYAIPWKVLRTLVLHRVSDIEEATALRFGKGVLPNKEVIASELGVLFGGLKFHADFAEKRIKAIPISFLSGLIASRTCSATEISDYIYAIVGFVSDCPVSVESVDYSKPAYQVYLETARDVIRQTNKLDILTACKHWAPNRPERQAATMEGCSEHPIGALMRQVLPPRPDLETMTLDDIELLLRTAKNSLCRLDCPDFRKKIISNLEKLGMACLPSWVPRWHWKVINQSYLCLNQDYAQAFNASRGTVAQATIVNGRPELSLRGVKVDIVRGVIMFPRTNWTAITCAWDFWIQESPETLKYPNLESQKDAFYRVCMRLSSARNQRHQGLTGTRDVQRALFDMEMGWGDISEHFRAALNILENDPKEALEYSEKMTRNVESQAFFICENGHIGLGPLAAKSGDLVCVLNGGDVPFLLRRAFGGNYYLTGEAYVDGIMNGEAIERVQNGQACYSNFTLI